MSSTERNEFEVESQRQNRAVRNKGLIFFPLGFHDTDKKEYFQPGLDLILTHCGERFGKCT